jgi:hypothetical protein
MHAFENKSPYTGDELLKFLSGGLHPDLGQDASRVGLGQGIEQLQYASDNTGVGVDRTCSLVSLFRYWNVP